MVHVLAPQPGLKRLPLFFTVGSSVGADAENSSTEDILLVQFLLRMLGDFPGGPPTEHTPVFAKVTATGRIDDATIDAIRLSQTVSGLRVDGRVIRATGYFLGKQAYTIADLNFSVRMRPELRSRWPRLDRFPGCPSLLGAAIRRAMAGEV